VLVRGLSIVDADILAVGYVWSSSSRNSPGMVWTGAESRVAFDGVSRDWIGVRARPSGGEVRGRMSAQAVISCGTVTVLYPAEKLRFHAKEEGMAT
jgi:hypothetical protein